MRASSHLLRRGGAGAVAAAAVVALGVSGLSPVTSAGATAATPVATATSTSSSDDSIVLAFQNPGLDAKPMARMWFPDAGAGADAEGLAMVAKQIKEMAAGGFGGVEVAFIADTTSYTNDDAATIGFGSPNWKNIVRQLLQTANSIATGFKVDFTITSHWPPTVNTIDPNDPQQQKEASQAYTKITATDLTAGSMALPLPETKTEDFSNTESLRAPFVFTDDYSSAAVAKVTAVEDGEPVLSYASLRDVSGATDKTRVTAAQAAAGTPYKEVDGVRYAGSAAGIPDQAYADAHDLDYQTDVVDKFGPEPASDDFDGKIDADGNRRRMADWQYHYATDLAGISALADYSPSDGDDLAVGDYVLIGNYYRGTGQIMSGGASVTQHNRTYATDYFSAGGVQAVFDFWDKNILDDQIRGLLKENGQQGTSIFEDSIEIHKDSPLWTAELPTKFKNYFGHKLGADASVLATDSDTLFDDSEAVTRTREDYNLVLGDLYENEHASLISDWAKSFGYTYRAQAYTLDGLDVAEAASAVDVPEGDNSTAGDGLRNLAGAVNMTGKKMLSMESVTFTADVDSPWATVMKELNSDFSDGVNRSVLHGSAFATTFNGYQSAWPGWNFRCCGKGFTSWNGRQIWWDDVSDFSSYVARNQSVMQGGEAKVDLGVLVGSDTGYSLQSGNSLQQLLDRGYNYNIVSEPLLAKDEATVTDGVLDAAGPAYKALVVKQATRLSVATVNKLIDYAQDGLPIILFDSDIERVYGTGGSGASGAAAADAELAAALTSLEDQDNVVLAPTQKEVRALLGSAGVQPDAAHSLAGLETSHRSDSSGEYYYLYDADTANAVDGPVTLTGSGTPYLLDASTGEVTPVTDYTRSGDKVTLDVDLAARNSEIVGLITDTTGLTKAPAPHAVATTAGSVVLADGKLALRTEAAGSATVTLSDGTTRTVTSVAPPSAVDLGDGWSLDLDSWGPDADANVVDPTLSAVSHVSFDDVSLGSWNDLAATSAQLDTLGVDSMAEVSGIGTYSRSFTLPASWTSADGYRLRLDHGDGDDIASVTINGHVIDSVNQFTNTVDVGKWLKAGANTISIKLDTSLGHRAGTSTDQTYGLSGIEVTPYVDTLLARPTTAKIVNKVKPVVRGKAKLGRTLTTTPGRWSPSGVRLSFQWLRDGKKIAGATGRRHTVVRKDRGHKLSVRVTARKTGYAALSVTSKAVKVTK
ncbi:MAG: glycosyl hydrolase [Nocardioides sp.]|uniref:glycosyl hydrolase n=1 Tax=Nocardioides sp. TaxID=35761 RepID=UPI0039E6FD8F